MPGEYANNFFSASTGYDDADRMVSRTTGAHAPDLLVKGQSAITAVYDGRGNVAQVGSSYGPLIAGTKFDAGRIARLSTYGDAVGTTTNLDYNGLRQLWHSTVARYFHEVAHHGARDEHAGGGYRR